MKVETGEDMGGDWVCITFPNGTQVVVWDESTNDPENCVVELYKDENFTDGSGNAPEQIAEWRK